MLHFLKTIILLCVQVVHLFAENKFHQHLTTEEFNHYFGTSVIEGVVPDYELSQMHSVLTKEDTPESHILHIRTFGKEYDLRLQKNKNLMTPDCIVQYLYSNGTSDKIPCLHVDKKCHYIGHVENDTDSSAAISTCNGVKGVISTSDHDLYIQPLLQHHKKYAKSEKEHLVIKRETPRQANTEVMRTNEGKRNIDKRSARHYLEIKVVVAHDCHVFHGSDTTQFVTTVMNMAAKLFLDPSLGDSKLYLALVGITILKDDQTDLRIVSDSGYLLDAFCAWQEKHEQHTSDSNPRHPDGTILITKTNLQKNGDKTNVGLGRVSGICSQKNKCTVNEDSGLDTSFTIAHELGHTLGMKHDGTDNNCKDGTYIMSSRGSSGKSASKWSACSAEYLRQYISRVHCMNDQPGVSITKLYNNHDKPGLLYSADAQCAMIYGSRSTKCAMSDNPCRTVCKDPKQNKCFVFGSSFADGTECGNRKWCIDGDCVSMGSQSPRPINGGWSAYDSEWTSCSRSCGGGVKLRRRYCNSPEPRYGGLPCSGKTYLSKLCNIQDCSKSQYKFREEQCTATNRYPVNGKYLTFVPFNQPTGDESCKLSCIAIQNNLIYTRAEAVADGTTCETTASFTSRCVAGKCESFGCDGHLGSNVKFDNCGVCNGGGSSCTQHHGTYTESHEKGFHTVITIPRGSTGITVTNKNKFCYLSVLVKNRRLIGEKGASLSGSYGSSGVSVQYRKTPERISIVGPIPLDIIIQVYQEYGPGYVGVAPEVAFTYYTPHGSSGRSEYKWITVTSRCSQTCGTGTFARAAKCFRIRDNHEVDDFNCDIFQKPSESTQPCNTQTCPPEWHAYQFGMCSRSCGGGTRTRAVECVTIQRGKFTAVAETRCNAARKPRSSEQCNTNSCASGATCKDIIEDCGEYGEHVCDDYPEWSKKNCQKHCKICTTGSTTTSSGSCSDKVDCETYQKDICTNFIPWSKENCPKYCNLCDTHVISGGGTTGAGTGTTHGGSCIDTVDCVTYQKDICTNYIPWAKQHCPKFCNLCDNVHKTSGGNSGNTQSGSGSTIIQGGSGSCTDTVDCTTYQKDICTNYIPWSKKHCAKFCNLCETTSTSSHQTEVQQGSTTIVSSDPCRDKVKCEEYGDDVCTAYEPWAKNNCRRHCKFCQPCADKLKDCADYGKSSCTGSYRSWAKQNCKLYCNLCDDNKQISTTSSPVITSTTTRQAAVQQGSTTIVSSDPCRDKVKCEEYGDDVCTAYGPWAKINCRRHCKFCQPCADKLKDCADYGKSSCTGSYRSWAKQNCKLYCNLCGDNEQTSVAVTSTPETAVQQGSTTIVSSDPCRDKVKCEEYGDDVCTAYEPWTKNNCRRHCKFCQPCVDKIKDCADYGKSACTGSYKTWAKQNCKHYCNICAERKKRSVSFDNEIFDIPTKKSDVMNDTINRTNSHIPIYSDEADLEEELHAIEKQSEIETSKLHEIPMRIPSQIRIPQKISAINTATFEPVPAKIVSDQSETPVEGGWGNPIPLDEYTENLNKGQDLLEEIRELEEYVDEEVP